MRIVWWAITAFVVFVLQSAVLPFMFNGVSQPNLIFVFVVLISLHTGPRSGMAAAILGGVVQDLIIGDYIGLHLLPYVLISFVCGSLGQSMERGQRFLSVVILLVATECCLILTCLFLWGAGQYVRILPYLLQYSIPMLMYHAVLALPVHHVVWSLRKEEPFGFVEYR